LIAEDGLRISIITIVEMLTTRDGPAVIDAKMQILVEKLRFLLQLGRTLSEDFHKVYGKTRMVWLPDGDKKFENMLTGCDNIHEHDGQTGRRTLHDGIGRAYPQHRGANIVKCYWYTRCPNQQHRHPTGVWSAF